MKLLQVIGTYTMQVHEHPRTWMRLNAISLKGRVALPHHKPSQEEVILSTQHLPSLDGYWIVNHMMMERFWRSKKLAAAKFGWRDWYIYLP